MDIESNDYNIADPDSPVKVGDDEYSRAEIFNEAMRENDNLKWGNGPWDMTMKFPNSYSKNDIHSINFAVRESPCEGHEVVVKIISGKTCFTEREMWKTEEVILQGEFWPEKAFMFGKALLAFAKEEGYTEETLIKDMVEGKEEWGTDYHTGR